MSKNTHLAEVFTMILKTGDHCRGAEDTVSPSSVTPVMAWPVQEEQALRGQRGQKK